MSSLTYGQSTAAVGNHKFPAILKHAIDQTTATSVQHAFEATGICPFNPAAICPSQLVETHETPG